MKKHILSLLLVLCMVAALAVPSDAAIQTGAYYGYYNRTNDTRGGEDLFMDALCIISGDGRTRSNLIELLSDKVGNWRYEFLDKDLNDGAGGDFIYLGWTTTTDPNRAITGVRVLNRGSNGAAPPSTKTDSNGIVWYLANAGAEGSVAPRLDNMGSSGGAVDLNDGADGDFLYLYVTKDHAYGPPLSYITASADQKNPAAPGDGYEKVLNFDGAWQDVNEDAGGDFIYLMAGTALKTISSGDVATLRDLVSRAEKMMNAGGYNISADDYDYKYAKYNILSKWNGTKYANSRDVTPEKVTKAINSLREHLAGTTTTIVFDAGTNGGSIYQGKTTKGTYTIGENPTVEVDVSGVIPTPKSGYEFVGWSANRDDTTGSKTTVNAKPGATYYAIFRKAITVNFEFYNTDQMLRTETVTGYLYNKASTASIPVPDTIPGEFIGGIEAPRTYQLLGWRSDGDPSEPQYTGSALQVGGDVNLYGVYSVPVILSFDTRGGNEVAPITQYIIQNAEGTQRSETTFTLPTVETPPAGFKFTGWNYSATAWPSFGEGDTFAISVDYTMYAYYVPIEYVATVTIGEKTTRYETFADAFAAAKAGTAAAPATVTLLQGTTDGLVTKGGTVILNINGQTAGGGLKVADNTTLTIQDTTDMGSISLATTNLAVLQISSGSKVTLESGAILHTGTGTAVATYGTFEMTGGELAAKTAIEADASSAKVTVSGGRVSGGAKLAYTTAEITGGAFQNFTVADQSSSIAISGGTFTGGIASVDASAGGKATPLAELLAEGYGFYYSEKLLLTLAEGQTEITETVTVKKPCTAHVPGDDGCCTQCGELLVASSTVGGSTAYHTELQEALDAAMEGTEADPGLVTLLQDITIGLRTEYGMEGHEWKQGVGILDLNGHRLTHLDDASVGRAAILVRNGQLTVRDSKTGGTIFSNSGFNSGAMGVLYKGSLILESGTIESANPEFYAVFIEGGSFTVNGGKVVSTAADAISAYRDGEDLGVVTINGGEVTGTKGVIWVSGGCSAKITGGTLHGGYGVLFADGAQNVEITGGTFINDRKPFEHEGTAYYYEVLNILGETETVITGGTYVDYFAVKSNMEERQELNTVLPAGYGFYDAADTLIPLTAGQTAIEQTVTVKEAEIVPVHVHGSWIYSASGATITATCGAQGCADGPYTEALTIYAPEELTFDAVPKAATLSDRSGLISGLKDAAIAYEDAAGTALAGAPVNAGSYRASVTMGGAAAGVDYTIEKIALTNVSVTQSGTLTYNGRQQTAEVTAKADAANHGAVTFTYSTDPEGPYAAAVPAFTEAGTHAVYFKAGAANYHDFSGSFTVVIGQAANGWTEEPAITGWTYGDPAAEPVGKAAFGTVSFLYSKAGTNVWSDLTPTDAGAYVLKVCVEETDNWAGMEASVNFAIEQRNVTVQWHMPDSLMYDGREKNPIAVGGSGLVNGDAPEIYVELTRGGDNVNAGTFTFTATGIADGNYRLAGDPVSPAYTIAPRELEKDDFTVNADGLIYNGAAHKPAVESGNTLVTSKDFETAYEHNVHAGMDTAKIVITGKGNASGQVTLTFSIAKAVVSEPVIPAKVYNGSKQTADLADTDLYTVEENHGGIAKGSYDVVLRLKDSENYRWLTTEAETVTLAFAISADENRWTTVPAIAGWTYGTPNEPVGAAKFGSIVFTWFDSDRAPLSEKPANAGSYYMVASVPADGDNYAALSTDYIAFTIAKADYPVQWPQNLVGKQGQPLSTVELPEGFVWEQAEQTLAYGEHSYAVRYTPADAGNYNVMRKDVLVKGTDVTAPTGKITLGTNIWNDFLHNITFGLFFKETQTISVTAEDAESGVREIAYYLANGALSAEDVKALAEDQWTVYADGITVDPANQYVVYVRIIDNAGNISYINSDGLVLDNVAPVISGIESGKDIYGDAVFKVDEDHIDSVTVDGTKVDAVDGTYTIPADNGEHTVVVTDKSGNKAEYTLTVFKIYTVTFMADGKEVTKQVVGHGMDAQLPEVPAKDGHTAKWDSEGKHITADGVITAVYTPIPKPDIPPTGDTSPMTLWLVLLLISGVGLAGMVAFGRKRHVN